MNVKLNISKNIASLQFAFKFKIIKSNKYKVMFHSCVENTLKKTDVYTKKMKNTNQNIDGAYHTVIDVIFRLNNRSIIQKI